MTVIGDFKVQFGLEASWSSDNYASLGNTLKPDDLQDAPSVTLTDSSSDASPCSSGMTYVLALTDPDAPSRDDPKWSEMCHWIAAGLAVSDDAEATGAVRAAGHGPCWAVRLADLEDVMPYKPPGPPEKTGKHRYVFLAFAPANGTDEKLNLSKPDDRQHWGTGKKGHGVRDWARGQWPSACR